MFLLEACVWFVLKILQGRSAQLTMFGDERKRLSFLFELFLHRTNELCQVASQKEVAIGGFTQHSGLCCRPLTILRALQQFCFLCLAPSVLPVLKLLLQVLRQKWRYERSPTLILFLLGEPAQQNPPCSPPILLRSMYFNCKGNSTKEILPCIKLKRP